jgi:predicted O-methyltransferase YrrM
MSSTHLKITDELAEYIRAFSLREPELLARLRQETAALPRGRMQITPEQGQFFSVLIQMLNAKDTLEIGVFTGYSSIAVALALPSDGKLIACDISEEYTQVARRYWKEAGVTNKIDLRLGPALKTLDALIADGAAGSFDFVFIDADKQSYDAYYERSLILLRSGGVLAIDNVLWHGQVADPQFTDPDTNAIRDLNVKIASDDRVIASMLPIGDGLTLALKRRFV